MDSWTKSATLKVLRCFFGPLVHLDRLENGEYAATAQRGGNRMLIASGPTPYDVFHEAILLPVKMKEARDALDVEENASESPETGQGEFEGEGGATPIAPLPLDPS